jgi:hypothetical protein
MVNSRRIIIFNDLKKMYSRVKTSNNSIFLDRDRKIFLELDSLVL